jgi:transposase-like protein
MSDNLPVERSDSTPALLGGQAALFENPSQLLDLDDVALKELAVLFGRHGASVFAQVRAQAGLLAWAGWFRFGEVTYSAFLIGLAKDLGVQPDTIMKWRRDVVRERKLAVPGVVKARSDAAKEGHKTAGQTSGAGRSSGKSKVIPVDSTEAPGKQPEEGDTAAASAFSSGPPSGGAELQPPAGPTDEAALKRSSSRSAPPDPYRSLLDALQAISTVDLRSYAGPWRPVLENEMRRGGEALGLIRSSGRVIKPEDREAKAKEAAPVDPTTCKHPKERRQKFPYMTRCGICWERTDR